MTKRKWFLGLVLLLPVVFFGALSAPANAASLIYSNNTNINLTTPGITLVIQAGSSADGLTVNASSVSVALSAGETFTIVSPQVLSSTSTAGGGSLSHACVAGDVSNIETVAITQSTGSATYTLIPTGSACVRHAVGSGGGGTIYNPSITISIPGNGANYGHGTIVGLIWTPADGAFTKYKVYYSTDNGTTWITVVDKTDTVTQSWIVPDVSTALGKIKVEGYDYNGNLLASATSSGNFTIVGTVPAPIANAAPPPKIDSTATGAYLPATALANTPDINTDKNLIAPVAGTPIYCIAGTLIKGSLPAVYYCGADGKRYVFVNDKAYFSWYPDFSTVQTINEQTMAEITIGGNITYRPGSRMVKIQSDPKVYAVARGGILRWIMTEAAAARLYGAAWNTLIDDVPDSFFVNYTVGEAITE